MNLRLQRFLELEQLSPARLADILGIQRSGISHILSGRNKPGYDFLYKMTQKFPTLNIEWLISGKGKVYKELQSAQEYRSEQIDENVRERNLFSDDSSSVNEKGAIHYPSENKIDTQRELPFHPDENRLNESEQRDVPEKKSLMKMILVYSDGTFKEFNPAT